MKKILLNLFLLAGIGLNAQVFSEGFEQGFPGQMTVTQIQQTAPGPISWTGDCQNATNSGGATCPITGTKSATFFVNSYATQVSGLNTPQLNLSGSPYLLKFKHIQRSWQGDVNPLVIRLSNDNGANWVVIGEYLGDVQTATERTINLSAFSPSATTTIQFAVVNNWGYSTILDDIQIVENTIQNDVEIATYYMNPIVSSLGGRQIQIQLRNQGGNTVNSFDFKYQIDNGAILTQNISGTILGPGAAIDYSHETLWNDAPGTYVTKVWVDNVNGQNDTNPSNNEITRNVRVASGSTAHKPLYEKFTSSTCGPCAGFNNNTFNPFYNANNQDFTLVNYQVNWPGNGDPYYTAETGTRVQYYGINAAPTLLVNGRASATTAATLTTQQNTEKNKPAYFGLYASKTFNGDNVEINYVIVPFLSGTYKVHAIVLEGTTTGNVATNGETSFKNVSMKMAPNASGTTVNLVDGQQYSGTITTSVAGTFIEEMSDLKVLVFIQDDVTKEVFQSLYAEDVLSNDNVIENKTKLFPNPTTGIVNIKVQEDAQVTVVDMLGKVILNKNLTEGTNSIQLEGLPKGVYFAKVKGQNIDTVEKIVLQ
jgi:hypothetical protein